MDISFLKLTTARLFNKFVVTSGHRNRTEEAKSFRENQEKEGAFEYRNRGIRKVPVKQIVGSVGRYHDFDGRFRLKQHVPADRLEMIKKVIREGRSLPPVDLYQIKDEYYVMDGNHRIAVAKEFGFQEIDAHVVEFIPSESTLENLLYRERAAFNDRTGLPYGIELTETGQYSYLIKQISEHQHFLEKEINQPITFEKAAADWYETIYSPLAAIIKKGRLIESFPGRTVADLFAYISYQHWDKGRTRAYGIGINELVPKDMEDFRKKMADLKESEYPEMQRGITAFVLMNVKANKEYRIVEKLFSLEEVREIHSIHGDIDIIAKIALKRDLLSPDSEIIAKFVHDKIRLIPGIISTRTLIPGFSKIKP